LSAPLFIMLCEQLATVQELNEAIRKDGLVIPGGRAPGRASGAVRAAVIWKDRLSTAEGIRDDAGFTRQNGDRS